MDQSNSAVLITLLNPTWVWLMAGALLCALELLLPASIFLWLGLSAIATGLLSILLPDIGWQIQIALFTVLAIFSMFAGRKIFQRTSTDSDQPQLNRRSRQYIGRVLVLTEAIENGVGRGSLDNTNWRVLGPDAAAGQSVRVTGMDGSSLLVEVADD